jgi:hypothetical protein
MLYFVQSVLILLAIVALGVGIAVIVVRKYRRSPRY